MADSFRSLSTVDPDAPFDDLDDLFGGARVVAIGESAHWVREYTLLRHRVLRFLTSRGPTVFALESGFSEGLSFGLTYRMGESSEMRDQLAWMRSAGVPYWGLDLPGSAATPLPLLEHLHGLPFAPDLIALSSTFASEHALVTYRAYAALPQADRDTFTALWALLSAWADTQVPGLDPVVRHEIRLGVLFDQMLRGHAAGSALAATARDRAMAETVFWLLDRYPDATIVIGAANGHIQRTPVSFPGMQVSPAGHHLASELGSSYLAVALTAVGGRTPARRPDPSAAGGVTVAAVDLEPPRADSIEAMLPGELGVLNVSGLDGAPGAIRVQDAYLEGPVVGAYDLVIGVPSISVSSQLAG